MNHHAAVENHEIFKLRLSRLFLAGIKGLFHSARVKSDERRTSVKMVERPGQSIKTQVSSGKLLTRDSCG